MLNDTTTPLSLLATRRSGKPRDMVAPGPDPDQLARMLEIAARTPDHGKLFPWRFVIVPDDRRAALADLLEAAYRAETPDAHDRGAEAARQFATQAPTLVVVLYAPQHSEKIPQWEQELSAGAACMNLLHAAHAMGFVGGWLTGWPAYSEHVRRAFGEAAEERIAGFVFIGSASQEPSERPRPDMAAITRTWSE